MRRILPTLLVGVILSAGAVLVPSVASATTSNTVAQPPEAVLGHKYSFQLEDSVYGIPTYTESPWACDSSKGYAPALPVGLKMSTTGLITGTPYLPEQTRFCVGLIFPHYNESVVVTMTVSSGVATLDPTLIPIGTSLAVADLNVNNELAYWEYFIEIAESYCIPPTRYCNL